MDVIIWTLAATAAALAFVAVLLLVSTTRDPDTQRTIATVDPSKQYVELRRQLDQVVYAQNRTAEEIADSIARLTPSPDSPYLGHPEAAKLMRELSHSLGTPLAGIKAEVQVLESQGNMASKIERRLSRIRTGVDLCQAFLLAYRNLGVVDNSTSFLRNESLEAAISRASEFYAGRATRTVQTRLVLPNAIPGYGSYQFLAAVLPLLENAVEGTADGLISIEHTRLGDFDVVSISNAVVGKLIKDFMVDGVSSKDAHQGLGIGVSQRIVQSLGGTLESRCIDNRLDMIIRLPAKAKI